MSPFLSQKIPMPSPSVHPRDPLHGVTLESILEQLVTRFGWSEMANRIPIRCFQFNPSLKSSLTFLRKTPWARQRVEDWFTYEQWNKSTASLVDSLSPPVASSPKE